MNHRAHIIRFASATALGLAMAASIGCASTGPSTGYYGNSGYGNTACDNCGTVTRIGNLAARGLLAPQPDPVVGLRGWDGAAALH